MKTPSSAAALLPSRLLRSLNTWKTSSRLSSSDYTYEEVSGSEFLDTPEICSLMTCQLSSPKVAAPTPDKPTLPQGTFDVLLQKDTNGLGFCLAVDERTHEHLIVTSFRRLHANDIGPAEASNMIHPGDILLAINGERVNTLQQVQTLIQSSDATAFMMLRFCRGDTPPLVEATPQQSPKLHPKSTMSQREIQMSMMLHDMAMKQELILNQLSEANMKVANQTQEIESMRIEIMQLRMEKDLQFQNTRGWAHGMMSTKPQSKAKMELDLVVTEAHNEMKRTALQHLEYEKQAIREETMHQLEKWKENIAKKEKMLEEALVYMVHNVDEMKSQPKFNNDPLEASNKVAEIRAILDKYYASRDTSLAVRPATTPSVPSAQVA